MLNDQATATKLKAELAKLSSSTSSDKLSHTKAGGHYEGQSMRHQPDKREPKRNQDNRVKKFIQSTSSLDQMFVQEKNLTASDEARMFLKTSTKFSRDDMETKYFSEEVDNSQAILDKSSKRHKPEQIIERRPRDPTEDQQTCFRCCDRTPKHLVVDSTFSCVYLALPRYKPLFSSMSNAIILSNDHSYSSLVSSSDEHQRGVERIIDSLREAWKSRGYRCVIMETYFRNHKPSNKELLSCENHFQIHCFPVREKYFEKIRMCFKQALQASGTEWSMNRRLIETTGNRIQRYLPKGLSYFWVCFDDLKKGFGHVIESEREFSRYFGFEVLSNAIGKEFNQMSLNEQERFNEQFERSRDFKLLYSNFRQNK